MSTRMLTKAALAPTSTPILQHHRRSLSNSPPLLLKRRPLNNYEPPRSSPSFTKDCAHTASLLTPARAPSSSRATSRRPTGWRSRWFLPLCFNAKHRVLSKMRRKWWFRGKTMRYQRAHPSPAILSGTSDPGSRLTLLYAHSSSRALDMISARSEYMLMRKRQNLRGR